MHNENIESLGYSRILLDDISDCSRLYGTEGYRAAVECLRHDVLNLKDGPKLRDIVEEFYNGPWVNMIKKELDRWIANNQDLKDEPQIIQDKESRLTEDHMVFLCDFIRQLLMDHGCIRNYYGGGE